MVVLPVITFFAILGERCSGTNFLENMMKTNFHLKHTARYHHKHWFGFSNYKNSDDVLFISIVRDIHPWIDSFYRLRWHLHPDIYKTKESFLDHEISSYYDDCYCNLDEKNKDRFIGYEKMKDRNMWTGERYKNIFELRETKMNYMKYTMPLIVKNHIIIRYEDLRDSYSEIVTLIKRKFNLKMKSASPIPILTYKGVRGSKFKMYTDYKISEDEVLTHKNYRLRLLTRIS